MEKVLHLRHQLLRSRHLSSGVIGLSLAILGLTLWCSDTHLRAEIRAQIAQHDGDILHAVSLWQQYSEESGDELAASLDDPGEQFNLMIGISRLKGVMGIRLFTPDGHFFNAFPAYISEAELPPEEFASLRAFKPVSHFYPKGRLQEIDLLAQTYSASVPLLVVDIPVHRKDEARLLGVAQFIMQGETIAREYAELDRSLVFQAAAAFVIGGGILAGALILVFRLLSARTGSLVRANQELALAAKTSAVGAVTAHLIHGLRNPLSGLQNFVSSQLEHPPAPSDSEWQEAAASTQRMQSLIAEVIRVLGEEQSPGDYEISLAELIEIISTRMRPLARTAGVQFTTESAAHGTLSNRDASLVILILENLIQNAIQATSVGNLVEVKLNTEGQQINFEVRDQGAGFPPAVKGQVFLPAQSTKPGGSGIGLAISKQLANHLGAELELEESTPEGCLIRLSLPLKIFSRSSSFTTAELASP